MATYHVRTNGSDAYTTVQAQDPATSWLTIDKAANEVAAADTVYVGAGTYRETVTMDTSGSSGSEIKFIADVDGSQTGDAGLVVISAFDDSNDAVRASCLDLNDGKTFVEWYDFVMQGGTSACVSDVTSTNNDYEGVVFDGCVFVAGPDNLDTCIYIDANAATTPTNNGLTVRDCVLVGPGIRYVWNGNETADQNLKVTIDNTLFVGPGGSGSISSGIIWDLNSAGTYHSGGVSITNCTILGHFDGVTVDNGTPTAAGFTVDVRNCVISAGGNALEKASSNDGALTSDYNTFQGAMSNVTVGANDRAETSAWLLGGLADLPLYRKLGWSPFLPWEPMRNQGDDDWTSLIGDADASVAPATDLYGNPRPMSQAGTTRSVYYFDASDAGPTDPDVSWTNDANAFDGDSATTATTVTSGTETTDELRGAGTNAPATGGTISTVEYRVYTGTVGTQNYRIYTDAEAESLANSSTTADDAWTTWATLTVPSGGWTWAKVQALELVLWASTQPGEVGAVQIRVTHAAGNNDDRGAVEGRARPEQETSTVRTGSNAIRLEGAGYHDFLVPVAAQSTTITVYAQYDGNYAGTLPSMTVTNDDLMTEVTDTQTGGSGSWEQLTSGAFTPSAAGVVKVRVTSSDTSDDGRAFFDDLVVA